MAEVYVRLSHSADDPRTHRARGCGVAAPLAGMYRMVLPVASSQRSARVRLSVGESFTDGLVL